MRTDEHGTASYTAEPFLQHYGDAIDDRVAEIVEDIIDEVIAARYHRPRRWPAGLLVVTVAGLSLLLRHDTAVVAVIWLASATMCVALSIGGPR
jgi:hypothetical protein